MKANSLPVRIETTRVSDESLFLNRSCTILCMLVLTALLGLASVVQSAETVTYDFSGASHGGVVSHHVTISAPATMKPVVWGWTESIPIKVEAEFTLDGGEVISFTEKNIGYITVDFSGPNFGEPGTWNDFNMYVVSVPGESGPKANADGWGPFSMVTFNGSWQYVGYVDFAREPRQIIPDFSASIESAGGLTNQSAISGIPVVFGDPVTGLSADMFETSGAVVSNIQGSGSEFTINVELDGNLGTSSISLPAGTVAGLYGGTNEASNQVVFDLDAQAPESVVAADALTLVEADAITGTFTSTDGEGSGVAAVTLWVKAPGQEWAAAGEITDGAWSFAPVAGSGVYEFTSVATDVAGNSEAAPSGNDHGQAVVYYNAIANSPVSVEVTPNRSTSIHPMEGDVTVIISFEGVVEPGIVTVSRVVGDVAPPNVSSARLIDQSLSVNLGEPAMQFDLATVTFVYCSLNLGELDESEINTAFRFDGENVSEISPIIVDYEANTITFETTRFSDLFFGNNNASVSDWLLMN